jgi:hypothetical protein
LPSAPTGFSILRGCKQASAIQSVSISCALGRGNEARNKGGQNALGCGPRAVGVLDLPEGGERRQREIEGSEEAAETVLLGRFHPVNLERDLRC